MSSVKLNIKISILIFFVCFNFSSCSVILSKFLSISEPKVFPKEKLEKYFKKNKYHLYGKFCYYIDEKTIDSLKNFSYKNGWEKGFRPLQFKVFDSAGKLILQYASCEGNIKKLKILSSYPPMPIRYSPYLHDTTYTIIKEFSFIKNICNDTFDFYKNHYDLHIVIYWAKWMGKPSVKLVRRITSYKKKFSDKKINIIFVNIAEISDVNN
jgi:hypothetical protein